MEKEQSAIDRGSFSWENWKAKLSSAPLKSSLEYPLFTDCRITGEVAEGLGPYQLLNAVPTVDTELLLPYLVLRIDYHCEEDKPDWRGTNVDRYHGGGLEDEIAALVSLCLGIRMKAGGISRLFDIQKDPRGRPTQWEIDRNPILSKPFRRSSVLPFALREHSLDYTAPLSQLHVLSAKESVAIVRAARFYQDAMWVAESEPQLCWLLFVSAIETAAAFWRTSNDSPVDRLSTSRPKLKEVLLDAGGEELLLTVADMMSDYMGATKKFVDFLMEFLPEAPQKRPSKAFQTSWEPTEMRKSLRTIYRWRSRALHGGVPFPAPMCLAPTHYEGELQEVSVGSAMSTRGAVWVAEDTPMLLYVFEYIVRSTLLNWWQSLVTVTQPESTAP
jgi:hypothetical protein